MTVEKSYSRSYFILNGLNYFVDKVLVSMIVSCELSLDRLPDGVSTVMPRLNTSQTQT